MDIFAHAFWTGATGIVAKRKLAKPLRIPWLVFWGIFPDLFAFGPTFTLLIWWRLSGVRAGVFSRALADALPGFLRPSELYHYSHSFVIFPLVFGLVWLIGRRPVWVMLGWALHISIDIFTHGSGRWGTPFLWPLSDYRFSGVPWAQRWFLILNYCVLAVVYMGLFIWFRRSKGQPRSKAQVQWEPEEGKPQ